MTIPDEDVTVATRKVTEQSGRWYKPGRCSICTRLIWFYPIALIEPVGAPEPRQEWILCKHCYAALLVEMRRSRFHSPMRLRIAIGLVAAERSPNAYPQNSPLREERQFQREFALFTWMLVIFAALHLVILAIVFAVPK